MYVKSGLREFGAHLNVFFGGRGGFCQFVYAKFSQNACKKLCSCLRGHNYKVKGSWGSQQVVKLRVYSHLEGRNVWHYISQTNPYCPWI